MTESTGNPSSAPPPLPERRRDGTKSSAVTIVKIVIAAVGIWFVAVMVHWNDTATLKAGSEIRAIRFLEPVEVQVVDADLLLKTPGPKRETVTIRFGDRKVRMEVAGQEITEAVGEGTMTPNGKLGLPNEIAVPLSLLEEKSGERVQEGLHTLLVRASGKWYLLLGAWALLGMPFFVTAIRWRNLMRPQGIQMPLGKCLQLTFVGQFYSIMLPGITGGDLVKIVYAARLTGSKTKSFITIILDRVIGLVALMVIAGTSAGVQLFMNTRAVAAGGAAAATMIAGKPMVAVADNTLMNVFVMIVVLLGTLLACTTIYFSRRLRKLVGIEWFVEHYGATSGANGNGERHEKMEHLFRVVNILVMIAAVLVIAAVSVLRWGIKLGWALNNWPIVYGVLGVMGLALLAGTAGLILHEAVVDHMKPVMTKLVDLLVKVDETLHVYRGHFGLLLWAFVISLISQLTLPLSAWLSGTAFGMTAPMTHYLAYVPVVVLAASLPFLPPQGLGVMDGLMVYFFVNRGTARAGQAFALAQAVRFLPMLWNLCGGCAVGGSYSRQKVKEEEREMEKAGAGS